MPAEPRERLLVTGSAGQLGRHVMRAAAARDIDAIGVDIDEIDITDPASVRRVLEHVQPTALINCAAYTNVDGAESDETTAFLVNDTGSRVLAEACCSAGIHLVHVSTDYVFPGTASDGYAEHDATGPINVYGASKLAGEDAIREVCGTEHACVARTAWLFSEYEPNFVLTIAKAAAARVEEGLDVVDDQRGNPTYAGHLADALVTCAADRLGGTRHLVGTPTATWRDLAQAVVDELGLATEVRATTSDKFVRPAKRAAVSVLRVTEADTPPTGEWRDGVRASLVHIKTGAPSVG
jgi:dTDP-4-dehydrorhamnose reductase